MVDRSAAAKFAILGQIYDLAREQREALGNDHLERFPELLDERDVLIARLTALQNGEDDGGELPQNIVAFPGASDAVVEDEMALDADSRVDRSRLKRNLAVWRTLAILIAAVLIVVALGRFTI